MSNVSVDHRTPHAVPHNFRDGGGIVVPTDGPGGAIKVPTTSEEWQVLGIPAGAVPTNIYGCQDASSGLMDALGVEDLTESGANHQYQLSVTGWTRKFVGRSSHNTAQWVSSSRAIAAGDSLIALAYAQIESFPSSASFRTVLGLLGVTLGAGVGPVLDARLSAGTWRRRFHSNNVQAPRDGADFIGSVQPYLLVRDGIGNTTDIYYLDATDNITHWEGAATEAFYVGSTPNTYQGQFGVIYRWEPTEAAALINAGFGDQTLLQTLGWSLAY